MSAPRIAFVIDELEVGGTQRQLLTAATGLAARGWTVRVVCLQPVLAMAPDFAAAGLPVTLIRKRARLDVPLIIALARFLRRERIEIVHAFSATAEFFAGLAARAVGCPFLASVRNVDEPLPPLVALGKRLACRLAALVIANSEAGGRQAVGAGLVPAAKLRVVVNGVAGPRMATGPRAGVRAALGVGPDTSLVVSVGRLVPQKAYEVAIDVAARLAEASADVRLFVAGDGPLRAELARAIGARGLGGVMRLLGERRDVPDLLGAADVYLSTSRAEGQSNAVMEAMAAGLPVVATAVGGTPELVRDGATGLLFDPGDAAAAARHVLELIADGERRWELGGRGRARVALLHGPETLLDRLSALYTAVAATA
ncbi:MAG TPA: glycosyltransferase [Methylomirabilota bacterium]|nr:glycosyltransferase [Methylomirabilota bacterium]